MLQGGSNRSNRRLAYRLQRIEGSLRLEGLSAVRHQDVKQGSDGAWIPQLTECIGGVQA